LRTGSQPLGDFDIVTVPTRRGRTDLEPVEGPVEAAEELSRSLGKRNLMPVSLAETYAKGAEAGYLRGVFRLSDGGSLARASVWDISWVHRSRVVRLPLWLRALGAAMDPLSRVFHVPRVPRQGETVAFWHLFDLHTRGPAGTRLLGQVIGAISRLAAAEGIKVLALLRPHGSGPALPRMLLKNTLTYRTMGYPIAGALPKPPLYIDVRDI